MADFNKLTMGVCPCCGSVKPLTSFSQSVIKKHWNGHLPVCKACVAPLLREYISKTGDEGAGLWCLCAELGLPFLNQYYQEAKKIIEEKTGTAGRKPDLFLTYLSQLIDNKVQCDGFWQSDRMLTDFIRTAEDFTDKSNEVVVMNMKEQERIWGKLPAEQSQAQIEEDYVFLNETFDNYTQELLEMDNALILRYRDLCKAELRKRKADESGDIQEIAKAQDNLKKMLDMLKLSNFQENKQSDEEKRIERMAWTIENTKPCECRDLDKYKDFSNFEGTWKHIMRCVQNLICGSREYPQVPRSEK